MSGSASYDFRLEYLTDVTAPSDLKFRITNSSTLDDSSSLDILRFSRRSTSGNTPGDGFGINIPFYIEWNDSGTPFNEYIARIRAYSRALEDEDNGVFEFYVWDDGTDKLVATFENSGTTLNDLQVLNRITTTFFSVTHGITFSSTTLKTANYTVTDADPFLFASVAGGSFTLTLPFPGALAFMPFTIKRTDDSTNVLTINGSGGSTVDGLTSVTIPPRGSKTFISDFAGWRTIGSHGPNQVPKSGALLTNANVTVNPGSDNASLYILPEATLTAGHTVTLGTTGTLYTNGSVVRILRKDLTANTYAVINGGGGAGTLLTFPAPPPATMAADFRYNGTDWVLIGVTYVVI
jgi:hypothetical protein